MSPQQKNYIYNLTPIRAIAAIMIAVFHFQSLFVVFLPPEQSGLIAKSYLLTDLFFVMSGFVIYHVYGSIFENEKEPGRFKNYISARFARIYPLHLFTLLICVGFYYLFHLPANPVQDPKAIPANLLLIHSMGTTSIFTWNVPSWSISAEWWAYMLLPVVAAGIMKYKRGGIIILSVLVISLYLVIVYKFGASPVFSRPLTHSLDITYDHGYLRGICGFLTGVLVYQLYRNNMLLFLKKDVIILFAGITILLSLHFNAPDLLLIPQFAILVLAAAYNTGTVKKMFSKKLPQFLGDISYSIYLMQVVVMFFVFIALSILKVDTSKFPLKMPLGKGALYCAGFIVLLIAMSSLTYKFVEVPARKGLNRLFKHKRKVARPLFISTQDAQ